MSQNYYGSIDFTKLLENLKSGKLKTYKTEKGQNLINVNVYVNDAPNEFGNIASISVPLKDEFFEVSENGKNIKSIYIGNLKKSEPKIQEASSTDYDWIEEDNLPM